MKPILQNKFGDEGNCLAACISSLFGCPIGEVPFYENDDSEWQIKLSKWFSKQFNKFIILARFDDNGVFDMVCDSLLITLIDSPNPNVERHAVITQNSRIIFDPMIGFVDEPLKKSQNPSFMIIGDRIG
jgi:hypothetical protein